MMRMKWGKGKGQRVLTKSCREEQVLGFEGALEARQRLHLVIGRIRSTTERDGQDDGAIGHGREYTDGSKDILVPKVAY